jgi:hypothetical protein
MTTDPARDDQDDTSTVNVHSAAPLDEKTTEKAVAVDTANADEVAEAIEEQGTAHVPLGA